MIKLEGVEIKPTLFPDKTSQVWKIPDDLLEKVYKKALCEIQWDFESEAEFIHVAQLKTLLDTYADYVNLYMPYLPYARQDKRVDNKATFALRTFAVLLNSLKFNQVKVLDAHNDSKAHLIDNLVNGSAREYINKALTESGANLLLFPDLGAADRYEAYNLEESVYAEKVRNQLTGQIEKIDIKLTSRVKTLKGRKILLVDDLCDAGGTFVLTAEQAYDQGAKEVSLYVTHGLFTKGLQVLTNAGIKRIFTYKGEVPILVAA